MNLFKRKRQGKFWTKELIVFDPTEISDSIVQEKGLKQYEKLQYDEQVKFCLNLKKFLILSGGWEVIPKENSEEAIKQCSFVIENLNSLKRSFSTILYSILSALDFGFSVSEMVFHERNGYLELLDIKTKYPWIFEFEFDDYGNLTNIYAAGEEVPREKLLIWSYSSTFGQIEGESDLKAVYRSWWLKKNVIKFYARYLERYAVPIVKGKIPPNASEEEVKTFFEVLRKIHNVSVITLPKTSGTEQFDFELVEAKRDAGEQFLKTIESCNEAIARGLLIPTLFGATKASYGSYALGELQFEVVYQFLTSISDNLSDEVINKQLIKTLIDLNFEKPLYPKFRIKPLNREFAEKFYKALSLELEKENGT